MLLIIYIYERFLVYLNYSYYTEGSTSDKQMFVCICIKLIRFTKLDIFHILEKLTPDRHSINEKRSFNFLYFSVTASQPRRRSIGSTRILNIAKTSLFLDIYNYNKFLRIPNVWAYRNKSFVSLTQASLPWLHYITIEVSYLLLSFVHLITI